jgi:methyl-accepting chemotaxis protein
MLRRFSIATRLFGLVGVVSLFAVAAVACVALVSLRLEQTVVGHTQKTMLDGEKGKIKAAARSMAVTLGQALSNMRDGEERQAAVRAMLGPVRFEDDDSGYFFVYRGTTNVALPPRPELVGKDLSDFVDRHGVRYVRELAARAAEGGGFVSYAFPKPSGSEEQKLSYAEMIPGTDMWVGTGVYIDNVGREEERIAAFIDASFQKALGASGAVLAVLVAVLCLCCLAIARSVAGPMAEATRAAERIAAGELEPRLEARGSDEAARLLAALGAMAATLRRNLDELESRRAFAEQKALQAEAALDEAQRAGREVVTQVALRIESLQKISSAVAHQLRNPTSIIGGMAGLLLKKPEFKERYLEYLDGIVDAARRIESITRAVSEYASIHLGRIGHEPAGRVLDEAREAALALARELHVAVSLEVEGAEVAVDADHELLGLAVRELAVNAVEALPPEGGLVRLCARRAGEGTGVEFAVSDTGRGIPAGEMGFVTDPFYSTKPVGVGMGLTKAARVAQEHGGRLAMESRLGEGTTARLILPSG